MTLLAWKIPAWLFILAPTRQDVSNRQLQWLESCLSSGLLHSQVLPAHNTEITGSEESSILQVLTALRYCWWVSKHGSRETLPWWWKQSWKPVWNQALDLRFSQYGLTKCTIIDRGNLHWNLAGFVQFHHPQALLTLRQFGLLHSVSVSLWEKCSATQSKFRDGKQQALHFN